MRNILFASAIIALLSLFSCTKKVVYETVEVPLVHQELRIDTLRDSIHVTDSVKQFIKGDTVYNDRVRTVYKWRDKIEIKKKVDSIYVIKPIPVEVEKPIPVEVEKKLTRWQKIRMDLGTLLLSVLGLSAIYYIIKYRLWRKIKR